MAFSLAVGSSFLSQEHPAEYVRGFTAALQVTSLGTPLFSLVFCPMNGSSSHLGSVSSTQGTTASCLTFSSLCHGLETLSRQYSGATVGLTSVLISRDHSHSSLVDGVLKTAVSSNVSGAFWDRFRWKGKSGLCHSVLARSRNPGNMIFRGCIHYTDVPKNQFFCCWTSRFLLFLLSFKRSSHNHFRNINLCT